MPRISTPIIHLGIGEIAITWVCRASRPTLNQILTRTLLLSGPTLLLCFKSPSIDGNQILCLTVLKMLGFLSTVHSYLSKQINNNLRKDWSSQVWGGVVFGGLFGFWWVFLDVSGSFLLGNRSPLQPTGSGLKTGSGQETGQRIKIFYWDNCPQPPSHSHLTHSASMR